MISNLQIVDFWDFPLSKFRPFLTVSDRDLGKHSLVSCYLWRQLTPGNSVALSLEGSQGPLYPPRVPLQFVQLYFLMVPIGDFHVFI